ncbi:MAG: tetratricopeptide repeat protein, partial [Deltaproteobacteria bacterium]|nr:tetratricopeptide repeat protein [Deltaproteobacteria bacterium]
GRLMPKAESIIILVLLIILSAAAFKRNSYWDADTALWRDASDKSPGKARPSNNLGSALANAGRCEDAVPVLRLAIKSDQWYIEPHYNLAVCYIKKGSFDEALPELLFVLKINDVLKSGHYGASAAPRYELGANSNLGNIYHAKGMLSEAVSHYKEALLLDSNDTGTRFNLAITYKKMGRVEEAVKEFEEVLALNPGDDEARRNLSYLKTGIYNENP